MKNLFKTITVLASLSTCPLFAQEAWKPVDQVLMTEWGKKVTPENVWQEYPRPQLERESWKNLNGLWSYAIQAKGGTTPTQWGGKILVPFAPESKLSGVGKTLEPDQELWYSRTFQIAEPKRTELHFEAVDYETKVWINGTEVGSHIGGHTPFTFDITDQLKAGENTVTVRVFDATEAWQLHGKQSLKPEHIWYTRVSGIWQTVWLEELPTRSIDDIDYLCDIKRGIVAITPKLTGKPLEGETVEVTATFDGKTVASSSGSPNSILSIPDAKLWTPDTPNIYDLTVTLKDSAGKQIDTVKAYTALRTVGKTRDMNGNLRMTLNGEPIFHWGPLDQGWWPDGLLTPPSETAMISDLIFLKEAGFNMVRKHIKIEPRRFYTDCDRLGLIVWQDQVSRGFGERTEPKGTNPKWIFTAPNPEEGKWPEAAHQQYLLEYKRMVDHLSDHPSIAVWVPFNEAWGQHNTMEVGKMATECDPTRLINVASGGNFWPVGDIVDNHSYPDPGFELEDPRFSSFVKIVGEFGGHGWPVKGHLWQEGNNWGYGALPKTVEEWQGRYAKSAKILADLRKQGIAGGVYTQTSDVEGEVNGLLTYDRLRKFDTAWLKKQSEMILNTPDALKTTIILKTASSGSKDAWSYTFEQPVAEWSSADFDASSWKKGPGGFGAADTANSTVGTPWTSSAIWMRKNFDFDQNIDGEFILSIHHDDDAKVYLNGTLIADLPGFTTGYVSVPLKDKSILRKGKNSIALSCKQTGNGQYIDVGLLSEKAY